MTAASGRGPSSPTQITVRTVALGIAFVLLLVTGLIADEAGRWHIVAVGLISLGFGISLAQWLDLRRSH